MCIKRKYFLERNCDGKQIPSPVIRNEEVKYIIDYNQTTGEELALNFCPAILFKDEDVIYLLELYSLYNDGFLLEDGGVSKQPFWYIYAMLELKSVYNYKERKQMEKQQ